MSNWYHLIDTHDPSGKGVWEMQFLVFLTLRHQETSERDVGMDLDYV